MATSGHQGKEKYDSHSAIKKPCRSCTDFKTWRAQMSGLKGNKSNSPVAAEKVITQPDDNCPLDKDQLGRSTWSFLHTMAANYPENPNEIQRSKMKCFINTLADFYPCEPCAADLREQLKTNQPDTGSQNSFSQWMCRLHNGVNERLGKPIFDCSKVNERWRDGWKDGSCD